MAEFGMKRYYRWTESSTGQLDDEELCRLRDGNPYSMVESLRDAEPGVQGFALIELVSHGNYQKAALLARALVEAHPNCEDSIRRFCGEEMSKMLFESDLMKLRTKPPLFM